MCLITPIGFFRVVQKHGGDVAGSITVRARVHGDLEALQQRYLPSHGPVQENRATDYRYRATAPRAYISAAMAQMISDVDYSNVKNEIAMRQGHKRSYLYHEVRDVHYKLQAEPGIAGDKAAPYGCDGAAKVEVVLDVSEPLQRSVDSRQHHERGRRP